MPSPLASHTLLLAPDPRQSALAALTQTGLHRATYDAYGHRSGAAVVRSGFNGQLREPQGWYHLGNGHRIYNPVLMRFHSPDQLSPFDKGGLNAYAYCVGDPVNHTDPSGQFIEWLIQNPAHSLVLNIGLTALNLLSLFLPATTGTLGVVASVIGIGGGIVGTTGAALQIAGVEEGRHVSVIGTLSSVVGMGLKVGLSAQTVVKNPAKAGHNLQENLHRLGVGKRSTSRWRHKVWRRYLDERDRLLRKELLLPSGLLNSPSEINRKLRKLDAAT